LRYLKLVFLKYSAHKVNLWIKHVLQDAGLRPASEHVAAAASVLLRSSAKLLAHARASMHGLYSISLAIVRVLEGRWSSLKV